MGIQAVVEAGLGSLHIVVVVEDSLHIDAGHYSLHKCIQSQNLNSHYS